MSSTQQELNLCIQGSKNERETVLRSFISILYFVAQALRVPIKQWVGWTQILVESFRKGVGCLVLLSDTVLLAERAL